MKPIAVKERPRTRIMSNVTPKPVNFLWRPWIPLGKLTVIDGDPGLGKSTMLLDIAARLSRDGLMPDGWEGPTGKTILLTAEDSAEDTIQPRLKAANAIMENIISFTDVRTGSGSRPISLPNDLPMLASIIRKRTAKLVIIDPFVAFLDGIDAIVDQDVRRALHRFAALAEKYACAILLLRHLNKAGGNKAIYRGGGSIGIIGAARSGIIVAENPDNPDERIVACSKNNLAKLPGSLTFTLQETPNGACKVVWSGTSKLNANDILAGPTEPEEKSAIQEACEFLLELLADGGQASESIKAQAKGLGIAEKTLKRAKSQLKIKAVKEGFADASWVWKLPAEVGHPPPVPECWPPSQLGGPNDNTNPGGDSYYDNAA